ncbi:MAG TPA: DUF916 domain-containing protein [Acidimicrobiales bacterium]|nr:DUF916 domain-containing protein [Acidimicrobiales bacterium]
MRGTAGPALAGVVALACVLVASGAAGATAPAPSTRHPAPHSAPDRSPATRSSLGATGSSGSEGVSAAASGGQGGCAVVHIGPYIAPGEPASSYFNLDLRQGTTATEGLVVANPDPQPCKVTLLPAYGATAVNGGDSYVPVAGPRSCVGASCWLGGLPTTITVSPHSRQVFSFPIGVPADAASGQYLAGIIGEPATPPRPASLRSGAQQGVVSASIVTRVAIGVAITLPGGLVPKLSVPAVTLSTASTPPSLQVTVANSGNTWIHPSGHLAVQLGHTTVAAGGGDPSSMSRTTTVALRAATVLPGDRAQLDVPVGQLPPGEHVVTVEIPYGRSGAVASWQGAIDFPATSAVAPERPGTTTRIITQPTLPRWVVYLVIGLALALLVLAGITLRFVLRRNRSATGRRDAAPAR